MLCRAHLVPQRAAALAAVVAIALLPAAAGAQGLLLTGLSNDHPIMTGNSSILAPREAQVRLSFDGALTTGTFDDQGQRSGSHDGSKSIAMNWDTSFNFHDVVEFGARLQFAYEATDLSSRLGPTLMGLAVRYQALDDVEGVKLGLAGAFGRELVESGDRLLELGVILALPGAERFRFDIEASGEMAIGDDANLFLGRLTAGPLWRPNDVVSLAVDLAGRYGQLVDDDGTFWDTEAGLRVGLTPGEGRHELAFSGSRTLFGERTDDAWAAVLTWRLRWETDDGFMRLDTGEPGEAQVGDMFYFGDDADGSSPPAADELVDRAVEAAREAARGGHTPEGS